MSLTLCMYGICIEEREDVKQMTSFLITKLKLIIIHLKVMIIILYYTKKQNHKKNIKQNRVKEKEKYGPNNQFTAIEDFYNLLFVLLLLLYFYIV